MKELTGCGLLLCQHEASRAAYEDARKQMADIVGKIAEKTESSAIIQADIRSTKQEASEARKLEQVCFFIVNSFTHFILYGAFLHQKCI